MQLQEKPPLGCKPGWLVSQERILELSEAIGRYAIAVGTSKTDMIREWATEILLQCDLLDKLEVT